MVRDLFSYLDSENSLQQRIAAGSSLGDGSDGRGKEHRREEPSMMAGRWSCQCRGDASPTRLRTWRPCSRVVSS
ncbi:MAG: hypothetical protein ACK43N_00505, partial [Pirellulaceae bacterium]